MSKRRGKIILLASLACLVAIALYAWSEREPVYHNRGFSEWFADYASPKANHADALVAMQAMCPSALPFLLRELQLVEPRWRKFYRESWTKAPNWQHYLPKPKPPPASQISAAQLLAELGPSARPVAPAMTRFLHERFVNGPRPSPPPRHPAVTNLFVLPDGRLGGAQSALGVEEYTIIALGQIGTSESDAVATLLSLPKIYSVAWTTSHALGSLQMVTAVQGAIPLLIHTVSDVERTDAVTRALAASALAQLPEQTEAVTAFFIGLIPHERSDPVREIALKSFAAAQSHLPEVMDLLVEEFAREELRDYRRVLFSLEARRHVVVPALVKALHHPKELVQIRAASALGDFGPHAVNTADSLRELTTSSSPSVQRAAANALWRVADDPTALVPLLAADLTGRNMLARRAAAEELLALGPRATAAEAALVATLHDQDAELRKMASQALATFNPQAAGPVNHANQLPK